MPGSYMEDLAESFARDIDFAKPLPPLSVLCLSCHLGFVVFDTVSLRSSCG